VVLLDKAVVFFWPGCYKLNVKFRQEIVFVTVNSWLSMYCVIEQASNWSSRVLKYSSFYLVHQLHPSDYCIICWMIVRVPLQRTIVTRNVLYAETRILMYHA